MKIKGFLVIFLLVSILVYFIWFAKTSKETIPEQIKKFDATKDKLTRVNMTSLNRLIEYFMATQGRTPQDLQELMKSQQIAGAQYDGWGKVMKYEKISDENFRLISAGHDGTFDTEDDIIIE
jgi:hypothetical protein